MAEPLVKMRQKDPPMSRRLHYSQMIGEEEKDTFSNDFSAHYDFKDIKSLLECPVCFDFCVPPIKNCTHGHIMCQSCHPKLQKCPVCRDPNIYFRNLVAENLADRCTKNCKYAQYGCHHQIRYGNPEDHEKYCNFNPFYCSMTSCVCSGDFRIRGDQIFEHFVFDHKITMAPNDSTVFTREMKVRTLDRLFKEGPRNPFGMQCLGRKFLQFMQSDGIKAWIWIAICDDEYGAANHKYSYSVVIENQLEEMKLIHEGPANSVRENGHAVLAGGNCLIVTPSTLHRFMRRFGKNSYWQMTISIKQSHGSLATDRVAMKSFYLYRNPGSCDEEDPTYEGRVFDTSFYPEMSVEMIEEPGAFWV